MANEKGRTTLDAGSIGSILVLGCIGIDLQMCTASFSCSETAAKIMVVILFGTTALCGGGAVAAMRSGRRPAVYVGIVGAVWYAFILGIVVPTL